MSGPDRDVPDVHERQRRVERWELEVDLLRAHHERDVVQWKLERMRNRRAWRMVVALSEARGSVGALLRLPLTLL
ncbi:MAG: hypothetical protein R3320_07815, partial [Nitriliruptorales bacterium]|nr:hypothetical protein [Nitriliruptorales bacterium]